MTSLGGRVGERLIAPATAMRLAAIAKDTDMSMIDAQDVMCGMKPTGCSCGCSDRCAGETP